MISLIYIVIFIFCLAIAVAGILISHQFISTYNTDFHKNYFYHLVSFYAFALYAIWGHILIRTILTALQSRPEVIEVAPNFLSILGLPFLFISWVMLINMAHSLFGRKVKKFWIWYHLGLLTLLILGIWLGYRVFINDHHFDEDVVGNMQIAYLGAFGLIHYSVFLLLNKNFANKIKIQGQYKILNFSVLMVVAFLLQFSAMIFALRNVWVLAAMILIFFASNVFPLLYLKLHSDDIFRPVRADSSSDEIIHRITKKYGITRREREVVTHICQGKTNQQIADELFISLQTVKDHTHRIYSKIGVKSRMQLVQLVNG
jgi:DNA-binding CsgD family transcriptional regulator